MWKIYYDDGQVASGTSVPGRSEGVVVIAQDDSRTGREIINGNDWYYMKAGKIYGADLLGLAYQLLHWFQELDWVGQGAMVDHESYERMQIAACDDPGLPPQSGYRKK